MSEYGPWRPGNDGVGKLKWFIHRDAPEVQDRYLFTPSDRLWRCASYESAKRRADQLNRQS